MFWHILPSGEAVRKENTARCTSIKEMANREEKGAFPVMADEGGPCDNNDAGLGRRAVNVIEAERGGEEKG